MMPGNEITSPDTGTVMRAAENVASDICGTPYGVRITSEGIYVNPR